jgi:hypothetical protein
MQLIPLSLQEAALSGFTHRCIITHADLTETATATAQTIQMASVAVGTLVDRAAFHLVTPFANSADAAFNDIKLLIGDGNDTDRYLRSNTAGTGVQINVNGTEVLDHINPVAASTAGLDSAPFMYTAADTVDAVFGSMTAKALNDLDTGEIHIFLRIVPLGTWAAPAHN